MNNPMPRIQQFTYQIEVPLDVRHRSTGEQLPCPVYEFSLCAKQVQFGPVSIRQWWMPHQTVFRERKRNAVNFQPIIDCYWSLCHQGHQLAVTDEASQETFLLASLLPHVRSDGARDVVADAVGPCENRATARRGRTPRSPKTSPRRISSAGGGLSGFEALAHAEHPLEEHLNPHPVHLSEVLARLRMPARREIHSHQS
jgi:hypothetical protein